MGCTCDLSEWAAEVTTVTCFSVFVLFHDENSALAFISDLSVYFVATRVVPGACPVLLGNCL
jgi:hypothetical protein